MVGRRVVILGSGDIGLIMARRMTLEGAKVLACVRADALFRRPDAQHRAVPATITASRCYLSHTITDIQGGRAGGAA